MDAMGPIIAASLAGVNQAEKIAARDAVKPDERPGKRFRRPGDNAELSVSHVEGVEGLRDPKGNEQEESHEDRQEHGHYDAQGQLSHDHKPRLDLEV